MNSVRRSNDNFSCEAAIGDHITTFLMLCTIDVFRLSVCITVDAIIKRLSVTLKRNMKMEKIYKKISCKSCTVHLGKTLRWQLATETEHRFNFFHKNFSSCSSILMMSFEYYTPKLKMCVI